MSAVRKERAEEEEEDRRSVEEEDFEEATRQAAPSTASRRKPEPSKQQIIQKIPEVVDDFLRNFLQKAGLSRTLSSFEAEWYGSAQKLQTESLKMAARDVLFIPHALTHRQLLQSELETVRRETDLLRQDVLVAGEDLVRMQRERDFHRLQYRQVAEDKNRLIEDFKQLKKHLESYEPALRQLEEKYQAALRQKMLISLKKDRVQTSTDVRQNQEKSQIKKERSIRRSEGNITTHSKDTEFPVCSSLLNNHLAQVKVQTWKSPGSFSLSYCIRAHKLPISCIDLHPRKLILASASDDRSWRLWALQASGEKVS